MFFLAFIYKIKFIKNIFKRLTVLNCSSIFNKKKSFEYVYSTWFFYSIKLLFALIYFLIPFSSISGQKIISGEIIDSTTGEPLIGAYLLSKDNNLGATTNYQGNFRITIPDEEEIEFEISYLGYDTKKFKWNKQVSNNQTILLKESSIIIDNVEIKGQRISDKQRTSPLAVESLDFIAIRETAASNFYDGLGALKDVDLTTASLGFTIINTRGFNSTSPVRSLQLIDGVDNQSPGLNFSLGNFLGASELDINKVELIIGASSAFYGPNAFNGVISLQTKDPFYHEGLSTKIKIGERNLLEPSFRWAQVIKNNADLPFIAYKLSGTYFSAVDWGAENYNPVYNTRTGINNPGGFDAVNVYGDEYKSIYNYENNSNYPGLGIFHRTGYREKDLVDYSTKNIKASAAVHFRLNPEQKFDSPTLILASNFGGGNTIYQGDNRFSLRNIKFYQYRAELQKRNDYFLRLYITHEDAGDSYDPYFTALKMQSYAKDDIDWRNDYTNYWVSEVVPKLKQFEDFPEKIKFLGDPAGYAQALNIFFDSHANEILSFHESARRIADTGAELYGSFDFFEPGTDRFDSLFNAITGRIARSEGGSKFYDKSALLHIQGEKKFHKSLEHSIFNKLEWLLGANGRLFKPNSNGSILLDTMGRNIDTYEFGVYTGATFGMLNNKLLFNTSLRLDKHQNFNFLLSPALSLVYAHHTDYVLRLSFSSAIRNPTLTDQYLYYNVGPATLLGNINGYKDLVTINSVKDYLNTNNPNLLEYFDADPIQPEQVQTIEGGFRATLWDNFFLDVGYYYSIYRDFIGYQLGAEIEYNPIGPTAIDVYRISANAEDIVTTRGFSAGLNLYFKKYFLLSGNYSYNYLITQSDDMIIPAYNTPTHKYNLNFSGRDLVFRTGRTHSGNIGFNAQYKWIQGFIFEGSPQFTGFIPDYFLLDGQINYKLHRLPITLKLGATNILNRKVYQTYGGPQVGRLTYLSISYHFSN